MRAAAPINRSRNPTATGRKGRRAESNAHVGLVFTTRRRRASATCPAAARPPNLPVYSCRAPLARATLRSHALDLRFVAAQPDGAPLRRVRRGEDAPVVRAQVAHQPVGRMRPVGDDSAPARLLVVTDVGGPLRQVRFVALPHEHEYGPPMPAVNHRQRRRAIVVLLGHALVDLLLGAHFATQQEHAPGPQHRLGEGAARIQLVLRIRGVHGDGIDRAGVERVLVEVGVVDDGQGPRIGRPARAGHRYPAGRPARFARGALRRSAHDGNTRAPRFSSRSMRSRSACLSAGSGCAARMSRMVRADGSGTRSGSPASKPAS